MWFSQGVQYAAVLVMLEKFKESVDKGNEFGALLTDLSKTIDCIDHKLLIAKLFLVMESHLRHLI